MSQYTITVTIDCDIHPDGNPVKSNEFRFKLKKSRENILLQLKPNESFEVPLKQLEAWRRAARRARVRLSWVRYPERDAARIWKVAGSLP